MYTSSVLKGFTSKKRIRSSSAHRLTASSNVDIFSPALYIEQYNVISQLYISLLVVEVPDTHTQRYTCM